MITHITTAEAWMAALPHGQYTADSLASEGFIHCSTVAQLLGTANAIFRGQDGLVVLAIDEARVTADIIYEDCYETGQLFPHVYGSLPVAAVVGVYPFPCQADGTFALPEGMGGVISN